MPSTSLFRAGLALVSATAIGISAATCDERVGTFPVESGTGPSGAEKSALTNTIVDSPEDLPALLATALASGNKVVTIPPGRYRVKPENRQHLVLRGLRDRIINATGVEMICTETTRAITIEDCHNVTLRGLTIDYAPLPYTQARILEIAPDKSWLKVQVIDGFPTAESSKVSVEIFDPATNRLRGCVTYYNTRCEPTADNTALLTKAQTQPDLAIERVGDIAVFKTSHAPGGEIPHAIMATDSSGLVFDAVTLFAANVFGFFENECDGSKYVHCVVGRRPQDHDLVPRGYMRLRSLNADAYHSKNAAKGPIYENCSAHFMGDDAIAINGDFHFISHGEGTVWRVLAKTKINLQPGDEIQVFTYDGRRPENRKIVSITPDGTITDEERSSVLQQRMNDTLRKTALSSAYRVELDQPESVPPGTLVCSANRIGNGFAIRDCHLGFNRSRGILVKAGQGEITGNVIEGSAMTAILVSPEYWWLEAGLADNLLIADNRIENGGGMGIAVVAEGGDKSLAPAGVFHNIQIKGNTVKGGAAPGILLTSILGLTEEGNTVEPDPAKELRSWQIGPWGLGGIQPQMRVNVE